MDQSEEESEEETLEEWLDDESPAKEDPYAGMDEEERNLAILADTTADFLVQLEMHHPYTREHSERVAVYCTQMALHLPGLYESDRLLLHYAALLHDIGKLTLPRELLDKQGDLSRYERIMIETHASASEQLILETMGFQDLAEVVLYHHESMDGTSYACLEGEEIPLLSRIIRVADSYDKMTTRSYKPPLSPRQAIETLKGYRGRYDQECVSALEMSLKELGLLGE